MTAKPKGLSDAAIKKGDPTKTPPYKMYDRDRVYIQVSVSGSRRWAWAYRIDGKDYTLQLGRYPDVGIDDSREARAEAAKLVDQGIHPGKAKKAAIVQAKATEAITFWTIAQDWITINRKSWSARYCQQVETYLAFYAGEKSAFGNRPVSEITTPEVYELVISIMTRKTLKPGERKATGAPSIAILVRQWSSAVFSLAIVTGRRTLTNPVTDLTASGLVKKPTVKNNRALNKDELITLIGKLSTYGGERVTRIAVQLLMLTFVRTIELRGAKWTEFDLDKARWDVPAERMKMKQPHLVPLSTQAVKLLRELKTITGGNKAGYLFPNGIRPTTYMSPMTINKALHYMGFNGKSGTIGFTAHGFRGTASTHLHEMGVPPEHIEAQLAHTVGGVSGAYNKARYLKDRIPMMQKWSDYIDELREAN
ncbi:tyrosine-type recombinase/integrase [Caballeronia sordidicola]|uniref:Integrase n=1 Tax=Caballeronia sordidicola TaxID=196367 RepID=A0A242MSV1_CABSO|nr:site-specific integrase [Caballeronia sordidicola]OTP74453.1 Integrase [Caballeronia sordidicola]